MAIQNMIQSSAISNIVLNVKDNIIRPGNEVVIVRKYPINFVNSELFLGLKTIVFRTLDVF